jgi:hypothetical protein
MKLLSTLFILFIIAGGAFGQVRTYKWETELCAHSGRYDSKKYTEKQLADTLRLAQGWEFSIQNTPAIFKFEDIASLDPAALEAEYKEKSAALKALDLVPGKYWSDLRTATLRELDEVYELSRLSTLGYSDPKALREYKGAEQCKVTYVEPLIKGGDAMVAAWRKLNLDHQKRNADPQRLEREFQQQLASPDRDKYALVDLLTFGWWNCANAKIFRVESTSNGEAIERFSKLFTNVKSECEEP